MQSSLLRHPIRRLHLDFTILNPRKGVLVLEVKDWRAGQIAAANPLSVQLVRGDRTDAETHPVQRARSYAHAVMDTIKERLEGQLLLETSGPHKGRILFPVGHFAGLPSISRSELRERGLSEIFEPAATLTREEVEMLRRMPGADIESYLDRFFRPVFKFPPLTREQMDHLRGLIHPEIVVRTVAEKVRDSDSLTYVPRLRVLDRDQERRARSIGPGHRLVFGVAGSGKTTVLIARAKHPASVFRPCAMPRDFSIEHLFSFGPTSCRTISHAPPMKIEAFSMSRLRVPWNS